MNRGTLDERRYLFDNPEYSAISEKAFYLISIVWSPSRADVTLSRSVVKK